MTVKEGAGWVYCQKLQVGLHALCRTILTVLQESPDRSLGNAEGDVVIRFSNLLQIEPVHDKFHVFSAHVKQFAAKQKNEKYGCWRFIWRDSYTNGFLLCLHKRAWALEV